jgi:hypothetical protein
MSIIFFNSEEYKKNINEDKFYNGTKRGRPFKNSNKPQHPNDKIKCEICGYYISRSHLSHHRKTKTHLDKIKPPINTNLTDEKTQ